ncbi:Ldh family oxidoreductase [Falsirhodobacter xinxiangensis]|uniref:Ldh family oxidoreductase n=1 Tax=Falsirhodobacter xinxiangensis TaxID=2530049 RepID=UPI0010AB4688|nr:Ldh family oxidoreductase [Rhodobacter xinxiangensis]
MNIQESVLRRVAMRALVRVAPEENARQQVDLLLEADLRGVPSHGLLRLPRVIDRIANGVTDPAATGRHEWLAEGYLDVDGGRGLGPVVALSAVAALKDRVARTGIAVAGVRNSNHIGMLGYYAEAAARDGLTMIALSTSEALVHPWGGRRAMIGTNPIAIGVPVGAGEVFMMDTATGVVSMGEIYDHANRGQPIPDHWALDAEGRPTTDATAAKSGAIAPFGQAKGYALGLAFELLVTTLAQSAIGRAVQGTLDDDRVCNKGDVFILIDGPAVDLRGYLEELRAMPAVEGANGVLIPGERGRACREDRLRSGVPVADEVWHRIVELAGGEE